MRYELFIGLRYLRAKRKEAFISLITIISMLGVTLGVGVLNIALSIMTGFEEDLRDRILGFTAQVMVLDLNGPMVDYRQAMDKTRAVPDVTAASPFVYGQVMLQSRERFSGGIVRGVTPDESAVTDLARHLKQGRLEDLGKRYKVAIEEAGGRTVELPGLIIGGGVARELNLDIDDVISVLSPIASPTAVGMLPKVKRFVVCGIFDSGMAEYDSTLIYMHITDAQQFFGLGDAVTGIEVRGRDLYAADELGGRLREALGFPYKVRTWIDINRNLFAAMRLEKTVYFIVLLLIVLVAGFNIVATLIMVVMEKRKDIAILKSMGATSASVGRIFIYKGMIIALVGTIAGNLLGYGACWLLQRYEFIDLPEGVFYVNTVPVKMYPEYFAMVTGASLLICLLATIYPARQASRLVPVDVIRYE